MPVDLTSPDPKDPKDDRIPDKIGSMTYMVLVPAVSLRKEPSHKAEQTDELFYGWRVSLLNEANDFVKVRTFYGYEGYLPKSTLRTVTDMPLPNIIVGQSVADAYLGTSVQDRRMETFYQGTYLYSPQREEKYTKIHYHSTEWQHTLRKKQGEGDAYIRSQFVLPYEQPVFSLAEKAYGDETTLRRSIIEVAKGYMGVQYRWGGKSHAGIDCSGLTFMAYLMNGIILYRDAKLVDGFAAVSIARNQLKPADLIYFKGHVALYLGENQMIHSSDTRGGVAIDTLDMPNPPWKLVGYGSVFA